MFPLFPIGTRESTMSRFVQVYPSSAREVVMIFSPIRRLTGVDASASAFAWSAAFACSGVMPDRSTPSTCTPLAIVVSEAKATGFAACVWKESSPARAKVARTALR